MSVTCTVESIPTGAFQLECHAGHEAIWIQLQAASYETAVVELAEHKAQCETCETDGACVAAVNDIDDELDVNVAQANAVVLLNALGLPVEDLSGSATAQDFLGRVILALADVGDDTGIAASVSRSNPQGMTFIECGVRPGYKADVFGQLFDLATEAVRLGRDIEWG
jgi:hypothetical protein